MLDITARVWFKNPESENSQYMEKAIKALGLRPSNALPSLCYYDTHSQHNPDAYSARFDHRFVFWLEGKNPTTEGAALKAFIMLGKWLGGYVEVSIAGLDFYHLGDYIGNQIFAPELSWEQEEKLKMAGLKHPLDRIR
jgi:hypothetical protein